MTKKNKLNLIFLLIIAIGALTLIFKGFSKQEVQQNNKKQLIVSVLPQKQIVERIAGKNFEVTALIPPGFSPETYDPTTEEIKRVSKADVYFTIGHIPFEKTNLEKFVEINPSMEVVDTSINNTLGQIEAHTHEDEEHEDGEIEEHGPEIDPHVWLAPRMVKKQSEVIYNTLSKNYPEYSDELLENYNQIIKDLDSLDLELADAFAPIKGKTMLVYHPAFGYLARDYEFTQEHIQIEGKEPSIADIQNIINEAKNDDVHVIFVQKQFNKDSAQAIADNINGVVVEIDPLAPDYFNNIKLMAKSISNVLK